MLIWAQVRILVWRENVLESQKQIERDDKTVKQEEIDYVESHLFISFFYSFLYKYLNIKFLFKKIKKNYKIIFLPCSKLNKAGGII